jgi:hypothetical protein
MTSRTIARAALLLVIISAALPTAVDSCFITTENVAVFRTRPDATFKDFLNGNLGVIQPRWDDRYLYAAYRQLSGQPFTDGERQALIKYYTEMVEEEWGAGDAPEAYWKKREAAEKRREENSPLSRWFDARREVPGAKESQLHAQEREVGYSEYVNCTDDALLTASATLKDRQRRFGKDNKYVLQWLDGQDAVFLNCRGSMPSIPANVSADAPLWLKQDRAYQQAAAYFYSQEWDKAHNLFRAVAADEASPWSVWGPYLAARCLVRKSTLQGGGDGKFAEDPMKAAEQELKDALRQTKNAQVHRATEQIMDFVRFRLHPNKYQAELNRRLSKPSDPSQLVRRLKDLLLLTGPKTSLDFIKADEGNPPAKPALPAGEIAEWMWAVSVAHPWKGNRTIAEYRAKHTLPWLVAALMNVTGTEDGIEEILAEAAKVSEGSPGYMTVNLHRVRLLRARGAKAEARKIARAILAQTDLSPSTRNLFRGQLASDAETFDEFLKNADGALAGSHTEEDEDFERRNTVRPLVESAWIFNHELPLEKLASAANSDLIGKEVRQELAPAVWTRAVLLGQLNSADTVAPQVAKVAPELKELMEQYLAASGKGDKERAAWFAILKAPGLNPYVRSLDSRGTFEPAGVLQIENFRDNWWCKPVQEYPDIVPPVLMRGAVQGKPDFISQADAETAAAEWKKLVALDDAPIYLANNILAWAKQTPEDPRIPEALHRLVRVTRYSCSDKKITKYSKAAYLLLHEKYPKSEWTKKTKYYF